MYGNPLFFRNGGSKILYSWYVNGWGGVKDAVNRLKMRDYGEGVKSYPKSRDM